MKFHEYQKQSIRTMAPLSKTYGINTINKKYNPFKLFDTNSDMNNWDKLPKLLDSVHMCLGMSSEIIELEEAISLNDLPNISEELADICWYISGELFILSKESTFVFINLIMSEIENDRTLFNNVVCEISNYCDIIKKEFAYRKIISDDEKLIILETILLKVNKLASYLNINMENALQNNINKLKVRFPDKFNEYDAKNRDLKNERKELER